MNNNVIDAKVNTKKNASKRYAQSELCNLKNLMSHLKTDFSIREDYAQWFNHNNHIKHW
ncbi:MAG: hypothetical protein IKP73_05480 [Bacteroidales bacterium]|nr:hypothetical protein [Bacteroidales bacterium]